MNTKSKKYPERPRFILFILLNVAILSSCERDEVLIPPFNSGTDYIAGMTMFCYNLSDNSEAFCIRTLATQVGNALQCGTGSDKSLCNFNHPAGVQVGNKQFIFFHNSRNDPGQWILTEMLASGQLGNQTDNGHWGGIYDPFIGFHVGGKGFVFGHEESSHFWFVQEITGQGKLGNETDNGHWHYYYESVTPMYVKGETYLFFQTDKNDHYWFITHVSSDGRLSDVCDGSWGNLWYPVTSVNVSGITYLIGDRKAVVDPMGAKTVGEWFIQGINNDGTMGNETDRGTWNYYYSQLIGYSYGGKAYIFGHSQENGYWFIQEITADGKMGTETSHGTLDRTDSFFCPFNIYDPGNFRFEIGWDLKPSTVDPANGWSAAVMLPWTGETKLSGGIALGDIDKDGTQRYDAVLTGIQDMVGDDRFYYKVAWNLNLSGQPSAWSGTFYGPNCGQAQAGAGATLTELNGNHLPELILMSVDDPAGPNSFWYYIGLDMGGNGQVTSWSDKFRIDGLGDQTAGGGACIGDIDHNNVADLVLMAIDDPEGSNNFRYAIGMNLDNTGKALSWTKITQAPVALRDHSAGGGAALEDLDGNGTPELILMNLDASAGQNYFQGYIGWNIDSSGNATHWTGPFWINSGGAPSLGNITSGGGMAIRDINKNGKPDVLLMVIDNPYGND